MPTDASRTTGDTCEPGSPKGLKDGFPGPFFSPPRGEDGFAPFARAAERVHRSVSEPRGAFLFLAFLFSFQPTAFAQEKESVYVEILVLESGGEGFDGLVGVAEVIRNRRWSSSPKVFSGLRRKDRNAFLGRQPRWVFDQAREALRIAKAGSRTVGRARNYLTVDLHRSDRCPAWAKEGRVVAVIGNHVFLEGIR